MGTIVAGITMAIELSANSHIDGCEAVSGIGPGNSAG